jgi:hypothetical protein
MMRRKGAAGLVAAGMLLLGAAPAQAQELAGARYLGSYPRDTAGENKDGTVDFKVSPDGTRVTEFRVINEQGEICGLGPWAAFPGPRISPGLAIQNHAFSGALSPSLWLDGSFTAPGVASGSFDLSPVPPGGRGPIRAPSPCPTEPVTWNAVGDATAPALVMDTRATQSRGQKTVKVKLSCPGEPCSVLAQGTVSLTDEGVARRFKLLSAGASDVSGETTLRPAIPLRVHRAIGALGSDGSVTARVRVTASDRFDNAASTRLSIQLKP